MIFPFILTEKQNGRISGTLVGANGIAGLWFFGVSFVLTTVLGVLGLLIDGKELGQQLAMIGFFVAAIVAWYHWIKFFSESLGGSSNNKH
jgi:hypothetical protein